MSLFTINSLTKFQRGLYQRLIKGGDVYAVLLRYLTGNTHASCRGVVTVNESLTAFDSVVGGTIRDGVTYVAGDRVLLVSQTTKSQNGIWVVGAVASGSAPLSRPDDFTHGDSIPAGMHIAVSEGTLFANTTWKVTTTGVLVVDTTLFDMYPEQVIQTVPLVGSTVTISNVPIYSATKSQCVAVLQTPGGTDTGTVGYGTIGAMTPGIVGTASVTIDALASGMTKNGTSDTSTITVMISN
jgi:hypothetical protein